MMSFTETTRSVKSSAIGLFVELLLLFAFTAPAPAQVQFVKDFVRYGTEPQAPLVQAIDGFLYGTSFAGGAFFNSGTVYRADPTGTITIVHHFNCNDATDGCFPRAGLIQLADEYLYGTTEQGGEFGQGTVFKIRPDGTDFRVIHSFECLNPSNGCAPFAEMMRGADGFLYGTTSQGGASNSGAVFKVRPDGTDFSAIHSFQCGVTTNGCIPTAGLIQLADEYLYGTTQQGGEFGRGTIFKIRPDGTDFSVIKTFENSNGAIPFGKLIHVSNGFLYGTTSQGGGGNTGTIFRLLPDGSSYSVINSFQCAAGCFPVAGVIQLTDGFLYGTLAGGGVGSGGGVFKIQPDGSSFSLLKAFTLGVVESGSRPRASLVNAINGFLYGTTAEGGANNQGTLFRIRPDGAGFSLLQSMGCAFNDGCFPAATLTPLSDGFLYGTTSQDGNNNQGTVFKIRPDGTGFTVIKTFRCFEADNGCLPLAGLVPLADGFLYGTTNRGGVFDQGTIYKIQPDGTEFSVIKSFQCFVATNGCFPVAGLIQLPDGYLYGTTREGGSFFQGTVFKILPDGSNFSVIKTFQCGVATDGCLPQAGLIPGVDDFLFGTTEQGGAFNQGTAFKISPDGTSFSVIKSFQCGVATDGCLPQAGLIRGDFFLYGTTEQGGAFNQGTAFKISPDGTSFSVIKSFQCGVATDGCLPMAGLIQLIDGFLYGTTSQGGAFDVGTVFKILSDGSGFRVIDSFGSDKDDGFNPQAGLTLAGDGYLYGTTLEGGPYGAGTIFRFFPDSAPPETTISTGPAGQSNSTSATFHFTSSEPDSTFACSVDNGPYSLCTSPKTYTGLAEGSHRFAVRATDLAGNTDATPATHNWTIDITPPDTTIDSGPSDPTTSTSASFSFSSTEANNSFACNLDGVGFSACSSPAIYNNLALGGHTFQVRANDAAANFDTTPASFNWTINSIPVDTTPPDTTITSAPPALTNSTSAVFEFTSNEAGSTFTCRLDGAPFAVCSSGTIYNGLTDGFHTFQVTATDAAGNTGPSPATHAWSIDSRPPAVGLFLRENPTPTKAATVQWTVRFSENVFGIDVGDFALVEAGGVAGAAITTITPLGPDTFTVTANSGTGSGTLGLNLVDDDSITDQAGNPLGGPGLGNGNFIGPVYTVDHDAPDTVVISGPPPLTNSTSASLDFTSDDAAATFECSLDGVAFSACATPQNYTSLTAGGHTFAVRAKDALGNTDLTPATHAWTIDNVAPDTTITSGPTGTITVNTATFQFTSTEANSTFECSLDGSLFSSCTSGINYQGLANGNHTFRVRAIDVVGNVNPSPTSQTFTVDITGSGQDHIYWADPGTVRIQRSNLDGSNVLTLISGAGLQSPTSIQLDLEFGKMYWIEQSAPNQKIQRANLDGSNIETIILTPGGPRALALDLVNEKIYWITNQPPGTIFRANVDGTGQEIVLTTPSGGNAQGLALSIATGKIHWIDSRSGIVTLYRANLDGTNIESLIAGAAASFFPFNLALDNVNDKIYWADLGATNRGIRRANLDGTSIENVVTGLNLPSSVAVDTTGQKVFWTDQGTGKIQRANLDGTLVEDIVAGLVQPGGITIAIRDTTEPDTTITSSPAVLTNSTDATFTFTANEADSTFGCSLDGTPFTSCTSPQSYSNLADGTHTFHVRATDAANNTDPTPAAFSWMINTETTDTTSPALASFIVNTPTVDASNGPANVQVTLVAADNLSGVSAVFVDLRSPSGVIRGSSCGRTSGTSLNGTYLCTSSLPQYSESGVWQLSVRLQDSVGNGATITNAQLVARGFPATFTNTGVQDVAPPVLANFVVNTPTVDTTNGAANVQTALTITDNLSGVGTPFVDIRSPSGQIRGGGCSFTAGTSLNATYQCTSSLPRFSEGGVWQFSVRMSDVVGNSTTVTNAQLVALGFPSTFTNTGQQDVTAPTLVSFVVNTPVVDTSSAAANVQTTLTITDDLAGVQTPFVDLRSPSGLTRGGGCSMTGGTSLNATYQCTSLLPQFSEQGIWQFSVRLSDLAGNNQTITNPQLVALGFPAIFVNSPAPDTTITANPPALTNATTASFSFTSSQVEGSFECSLDGVAFNACGSPQSYSNLSSANHTFQVRAVNAFGGADPSPASYVWTIDAVEPDTNITANPPALSNSSSASFSFTASEAGISFACSLDGAAFAPCTSPQNYAGLAAGSHTFQVRATDAANNTDPTPASSTWTVDLTAPNTSITSNPPASTNTSSATFAFASTEAGTTFACSLDGGPFAACTNPTTYSGLSVGSHSFRVRATDPAGNTDPTPASYNWTIDVVAPNTTITLMPPATTNKKNAQFKFTSTEASSTFQCSLDGATFATCTSPQNYNGLSPSNHSFQVRAIDAAGNVDATPASYSWTVQ